MAVRLSYCSALRDAAGEASQGAGLAEYGEGYAEWWADCGAGDGDAEGLGDIAHFQGFGFGVGVDEGVDRGGREVLERFEAGLHVGEYGEGGGLAFLWRGFEDFGDGSGIKGVVVVADEGETGDVDDVAEDLAARLECRGEHGELVIAELSGDLGAELSAPGFEAFDEFGIAHFGDELGIKAGEFDAIELGVGLADALDGEILGEEADVETLEVFAIGGFDAGGPAQERDEVGDGFGEIAGLTEIGDFDFGKVDLEDAGHGLGDVEAVVLGGEEIRDRWLFDGEFGGEGGGGKRGIFLDGVLEREARDLGLIAFAHLAGIHIEDEGHVGVGRCAEGEGLLERDVPRRVVEVLLGAHDVGDAHGLIIDDDGEVVGGKAIGLADDEVVEFAGGDFDVAEDLIGDDEFV